MLLPSAEVSRLLLIRHAQASFGSANYDVLSSLGIEQARCLGAHLASRAYTIDALYTGPAERHRDTAAHLRAAAAESGVDVAEPSVVDALDEYPALPLLERWLPKLGSERPEIARALTDAGTPAAIASRALEYISLAWAQGELDTGDLESYEQFERRIDGALTSLREREGRGRTVAVVTSGGPVAMAVRHALDLAPRKTLELAWVVANASLTELRYRDPIAASLIAFNRIPHLTPDHLVTYR